MELRKMKRGFFVNILMSFFLVLSWCVIKADSSSLIVTLHVEIEQSHEVEGIPQWEWSGSYVHALEVSEEEIELFWNKSRFVPRKQAFSEAQASGTDFCRTGEPSEEYTIQWSSRLNWDTFNEPKLLILEKGKEVWILYDLPRAVEIRHPGAPPCGPVGGIDPNSIQERNFFIGDLEEDAKQQDDHPVYVYDENRFSGGFFLLAFPREDLRAGKRINKTILYQGQYNKLRIQVEIGS